MTLKNIPRQLPNYIIWYVKFINRHFVKSAIVFLFMSIGLIFTLYKIDYKTALSQRSYVDSKALVSNIEPMVTEKHKNYSTSYYPVTYTYKVNQEVYTKISYETTLAYQIGDSIAIAYDIDDPMFFQNDENEKNIYLPLIASLLLIIVLIVIIYEIKKLLKLRNHVIYLLTHGYITKGLLHINISKREIVNKRKRIYNYQYKYTFYNEEGTEVGFYFYHRPKLVSKKYFWIAYHPDDNSDAIVIDYYGSILVNYIEKITKETTHLIY